MSFDFEYENYLEEDEIDGRHTENQNTNSQQQSSNQKSGGNASNGKKELIKGVECSARSTERFTVRFVNTTDKCVDVIWLDFEGQPVTYETLQPQTAWSVYTYKVDFCYIAFKMLFESKPRFKMYKLPRNLEQFE